MTNPTPISVLEGIKLSELTPIVNLTGEESIFIVNDGISYVSKVDNVNRLIIKTITQNYTVIKEDSSRRLLRFLSAENVTITVSVPFNDFNILIGSCFLLSKSGDGDVLISGAPGVVINTPSSNLIDKKHGKATLIKVSQNEWDLEGNLSFN